MPWGQKSKLCACEKYQQASSETQGLQGAQATASEEKEYPSSSSPLPDDNPKNSPVAESCSKYQKPQRVLSMTTTSVGVSCTKSDEDSQSQDEESQTLQALYTSNHSCTTPLDENKHFPEILKKSSELMVLAFGIEVKEVDPTRKEVLHLWKLITQDLVQERYLEYQQVPSSDPPKYQFLWGPWTHAKTSKMRILEFLAKIHDVVPSAFPSWYEEALRDEE
ncbi:melanoma-associated antigen B10-like [Callospermophilus lateralis]|uniref:melanoma-associated antigen B10-like n=1 Tax=Callospermophilus lateralis TaxID=76772 RepID=UPI004054198B